MNKNMFTLACVAASLLASAAFANASAIAFDSAGDSAYNGNGAFIGGVNGGYGWGGPWSFSPNGSVAFVGSSSANGNGDPAGTGDINTPRTPLGRAWALTDSLLLGRMTAISRPLSGALAVGQILTADFDVGKIFPDASVAVVFQGKIGPAVVATASRGDYLFADGYDYGPEGGVIDSGVPVSSRGVHIAFTPLDGSTAQLSVTSVDTGATGSAILPYANVVALGIYNNNDLFLIDHSYDVYFNNIAVTPEPAGPVIALLASTGLLRRTRRIRKSSHLASR